MESQNHPCFSAGARHRVGRIHLPVAPKCNMQCNYCNRDFACVNESRPGVSSTILTPCGRRLPRRGPRKGEEHRSRGHRGPGDPFANVDESLETLRLVREKHPDITLCVATNGLEVWDSRGHPRFPGREPRDRNHKRGRSGDREEDLRVGADGPQNIPWDRCCPRDPRSAARRG